jgi:periplasmic divalent cation tolerance protein
MQNSAITTREVTSVERAVFVYSTVPDMTTAETIGQALVEQRLAACVNIIPGMVSIYRWQDAVERASELVLIVKTRAALTEAVSETIRALHPYETPVVAVIPLDSVESHTLAWLLETTAVPQGG